MMLTTTTTTITTTIYIITVVTTVTSVSTDVGDSRSPPSQGLRPSQSSASFLLPRFLRTIGGPGGLVESSQYELLVAPELVAVHRPRSLRGGWGRRGGGRRLIWVWVRVWV